MTHTEINAQSSVRFTHQHTNTHISTFNTPTHQLINTQTHSTHQHININAQLNSNTPTHQSVNRSSYQYISLFEDHPWLTVDVEFGSKSLPIFLPRVVYFSISHVFLVYSLLLPAIELFTRSLLQGAHKSATFAI